MGSCFIGTGFQFREIKKALEMNSVNVCSSHAAGQHVNLLNAIELYT